MLIRPSTYTPATLARAIVELDLLPPLDAARRSRDLVDEAKTVLGARGDAAVVDALASSTYEQVAQALGVTTSTVNKAVSRHRLRAKAG